jgi:hypothetical protein
MIPAIPGILGAVYGGEYMQSLHLQIHPGFIPISSRVLIWDFRLRIADWWNRYALSIISMPNCLNIRTRLIARLRF